MTTLDTVGGVENDLRVAMIHSPITVQVVHAPIPIIIDENIGCITVHVPTHPGATVTTRSVVLRSAKAAHHRHAPNGDASAIEISDYQLELVDQFFPQDQVLGPGGPLSFREKIAQAKVLRYASVLVLPGDLDEVPGVLVGY